MLLDSRENIRSFGRIKKKKLSENDARLMLELLPQITFDVKENLNFNDIFQNNNKNQMEIGFGYGESLIQRAINNPNINYIGCETYINGVAHLLSLIESSGVKNIKIINGDSRLVLDKIIDNNLDKIFLLFPDPWPKQKQQKRRIVNEKFIEIIQKKLNVGGRFFFASDIVDYVNWVVEKFSKYNDFTQNFKNITDTKQPDWWIKTRYQEKALKENRDIYFLRYVLK